MRRLISALLLAFVAGVTTPALAVLPDEMLDDPALEARARDLSAELRCLVCQNQSIDDSNADLAREIRILLRERLVEGDTDQEILDFLVSRYGQFILLKPQFNAVTAFLWIAPGALLLGGGFLAYRVIKRRSAADSGSGELSPEEEARLQKILGDTGQS